MKRIVYRPHIFLLACLCLLASKVQGQTGIRSFDYATTNAPNTVDVLRADANGNIYVAGKYPGNNASIDFSPYGTQAPLTDTGTTTDIFIAKYDAGGVLLWLRNAMSEQSTFMEVTDLEVDASGNVFVAGSVTGNAAKFYDATTNYDVSGGAASYSGAYVVKYSYSGVITWVWNKKHITTQYYAKGIEIDGPGNIHVGGYTNDGTGNELSIAVLNSAGTEQSFHELATISGAVTVAAFDRDASGNYYYTGSTNAAVTPEAFVSKFNSSRVHQWNSVVRNFATAGGIGGGFAERGVDIEVDGSGNVFALFNGTSDAFVTKHNSGGSFQSSSFRLTATNGNTGRDLALDASGNVIIAGSFRGTADFDPGAGTATGGDAFGAYYLASYTSNLAYNWSRVLNHNSQTSTRVSASADVDPLGKIHIAYHYDNTGFRKGLITTYSLAGDVTAPTAITFNPADNATNVALSASPQITFSESVSLVNGGTITIRKTSNLAEFESFTIPSARLTMSGNTLTINPTNDFPVTSSGSTAGYYVTISGGAIKDASHNFFAPITTSNVWNFSTIIDSSGPALISRTPTPGSTGIDLAVNLTIGFNENIVAHTGGSVTLQRLVSGAYTTVQTFSLPSALVQISGAQATINPTADLSHSSTYQVLVSSNAFKDAAGNFFAGQTAGAWTFSTMAAPDAVAPTVATFSPADNATTASITGNLTLTFSEDVAAVSSKVINLIQTSGTTLIESFTLPSAKVQVSGNSVTINPTLDLGYNTAYHVTVEAGAFEDAAGNDFTGITNVTTWNFTTQQDPSDLAPFLTTLNPANGASGVSRRTNLQGSFSEAVSLGTSKALEIRRVSDNSVVEAFTTASPGISLEGGLVITPTNDLPGNTALYVYFESGFVQDGNSNPMAAVSNSSTWSFTTAPADVIGPALSSTAPVNGEVNVSDELSAIYLQFNEDVFINTGTITISGSGFNETIDVTESENIENESDGLIILYLVGQLPNNTAISVSAPAGVVVDEWNNNSGSFSFSFTTEVAPDEAAPVVNTYFPAIGEAGVPFQRWLSLTFNEAIQYAPTADKYLRIYNSNDVLVDEVLVVSGSFSAIAGGTTLRLYYQKNLEFGVEHYVTLDAGAVKDMSGNDFAGIGADEWYFTVESKTGALSRYSNFVPAKNATGVDNSLGQLSFNLFFPNKQGGSIALRKVSDNALVKEWAVTDSEVTITGGGHTVNATNIPELEYNTAYYVELTGTSFSADGQLSWGAFYAPEYVQYLNFNDDNTFWRFTTEVEPDSEAPTIVSFSPADDATDVAVATNLVATFSENVSAVTSKVVSIKNAGGEVPGAIFESFTLPSANVTISGSTVTINPTSNMANLGEYYVNIEAGAFTDAAGNPFAGITNATSWNFTTVPASAPVATAIYPVNNATNIPVGVNSFTIVFDDFTYVNESATGTVQLKKLDGTVVLELTASNLGSGYQNVSFFMGDVVLEPYTTYYFTIGNDLFRKSGGVSYYTGISDNTTWRFTTGGPNSVINSFLPGRFATDVSTSLASIKMYFNSEVYDSYGYYRLRKSSDNSLVKQWDVSADITYGYDEQASLYFAELPLSAALEAGTTYYIDNQFNNAGGYEPGWMEYDFEYDEPEDVWTTARIVPWVENFWEFTTEADLTAPVVLAFSPANKGVQVAIDANLTITFDKDVAINNAAAEVSIFTKSNNSLVASYSMNSAAVTVNGTTVSVNPSVDFSYETIYYVLVDADAIEDAGGNSFAGISSTTGWQFHTTKAAGHENEAPYIVFYEPEHLTDEFPLDGTVTFHFNEPIRMPFLRVFSLGSDENYYSKQFSIGSPGATANLSGNKLIITDPDFPYFATGVHLNLPSNTVWNDPGAGNDAVNTKDSDTWVISTSTQFDPSAPPLTINEIEYPANNATDVYWTAGSYSFTLSPDLVGSESFSVYKNTTGGIRIKKLSNDQVVAEYTGAEVRDFLNPGPFGTTVYFATELEPSTTYYITIDDDVIYNTITGSFFEGIQDNTTWRFTTESIANYESRFASFSPSRGAVDVDSELSELLLIFNEEAYLGNGASLRLRKAGTNEIVKEWDFDSPDYENIDNLEYTFSGFELEPETAYYVENTFQNDQYPFTLSLDYMGSWPNDFWTFTTGEGPDETPPGAASFSPANNATEVPLATTSISITFNEAIKIAASGATKQAIIWWTPEGESLTNATVDLENESAFTISGNTLVMNFDGWLPGLTYYVTLADGVIADLANNWFGGWTGSATWSFTTEKANQTITFNELPARTLQQGNFTLEATASSSLDVSYSSSNPSVATVSGNTVTVVGTGTTTITASQAGNNNYNAALPVERTLFVTDATKTNQSITFNTLAERAFGSGTFQLEASASSGLAVSYSSSNTAVATVAGNTVTIVGLGETTITASQTGNETYNPAPTVQQVLTVVKGSQTITFAALASKTFGDAAFDLTATGGASGNDIAFVSSNTSVATISGSTVTIVGAGTTTITASQAGNANYNAAPDAAQILTVNKASQTIAFAALADKTFGDAAFDLTATGGGSGNTITFTSSNTSIATISGSTVTIVGAGTTTITASQAANSNYEAATSVERTLTVAKKAQTITVASIANKLTTDAAFSAEATTDSGLELTYAVSGPAAIAGATITLSGEVGTVTVTVAQAGNDNYLAAEASASFEVTAPASAEKQAQTITFVDVPNKTFGDAAFDLDASSTSALAVSFEVVSGPVTMSGNTVTISGAGTATIKAVQAGNDAFNAATPVEKTFTIAKKGQVITISPIANQLATAPSFEVEAIVNSPLSLSYAVSGPATLSGVAITLTGQAGTVTVTVSQAGNDNYLATEASVSFEAIIPVPTTFSLSGSAVTSSGQAFGSGQANLYLKNKNGTFAAAIGSALSATGTFEFTGLEAGEYALGITSSVNSILTTYYVNALSLADATIINIATSNVGDLQIVMKNRPVALTGPGTIKGTLLEAADGGRTIVMGGRTMEGSPLAGITIFLLTSPGNEMVASTVTAADGTFQFANLPLGAYKLVIDYEGKTTVESPEIVLTPATLSFDVASEITEEGIVIVAEPATTTGVASSLLSQSLTAYPNPSMGLITIEWDGAVADVQQIIVHNNNGSAIWTGALVNGRQTIDISHHPKGVYFLRLITSTGAAIQKLVIK